MKHVIVLQWPAASLKDYDTVVEIEDVLTQRLSAGCEVDGHDVGSGDMNIFIHTNDPVAAFYEAREVLGSRDFWVHARVAYRELSKSE